ncbi:ankyrin repeat-containing domain protein [Fusarium oxysporum]|nr:ankyrin repeat-containing domain protein [Fusarium oxysporum]
MAELLLDYGVDIDARDKEGKTALYWFFKRGQLAAAELLIKRGADVKALSDYGETMLHRANDDTLSLCPVLLERGVDVNALTIEGWSPLAFALNRNVAIREEKRGLTRADLSEKERLLAIPEVKQVAKLLVEKGG